MYRVLGLQAERFHHLYGLSDSEMKQQGASRYIADKKPGFPDRIELRDVEPGEAVLLLNFVHQPAANAYRSSHAIFIREGATRSFEDVDAIPETLRVRPISLRAFNHNDEIADADVVDGGSLEPLIKRFLSSSEVSYLHAHYAKRGCYAARIERT